MGRPSLSNLGFMEYKKPVLIIKTLKTLALNGNCASTKLNRSVPGKR